MSGSESKLCVIGIDPGLDGGVAVMHLDDHNAPAAIQAFAMPTRPGAKKGREIDARELWRGILAAQGSAAIGLTAVELVHAMPTFGRGKDGKNTRRQGVTSMFNFGMGYGLVLAVLEILTVPSERVTPQRWKGVVLDGYGREKEDAIRYVLQRFPKLSLLRTPQCSTPHDGMAEAACIAEYARRKLCGQRVK